MAKGNNSQKEKPTCYRRKFKKVFRRRAREVLDYIEFLQ